MTVLGRRLQVSGRHPRNHNGTGFSVLVTRTVAEPRPGSDEISRASEEAWIGADGYLKGDGTRQRRAIAFQGQVVASDGSRILEAFVVDIPEDVTIAGEGPLEGTETTRPRPPKGTVQRRLTRTSGRKYPGAGWAAALAGEQSAGHGDRFADARRRRRGAAFWRFAQRRRAEADHAQSVERRLRVYVEPRWEPHRLHYR